MSSVFYVNEDGLQEFPPEKPVAKLPDNWKLIWDGGMSTKEFVELLQKQPIPDHIYAMMDAIENRKGKSLSGQYYAGKFKGTKLYGRQMSWVILDDPLNFDPRQECDIKQMVKEMINSWREL
ncbi:MAG: hypothetical protein V4721_00385 [Bacteroidota bacterium]